MEVIWRQALEYTVFDECITATVWFYNGVRRGSVWFMTACGKISGHSMQEWGRSAKEKPSRNGWASIYQLASRAGSARPQLLASRLAK